MSTPALIGLLGACQPAAHAPAVRARVVCAPVQGPTKLAASKSLDEVAALDGSAVLEFASTSAGVPYVALADRSGSETTEKLPDDALYSPGLSFRGANVVGFGRRVSPAVGGGGYVAWATTKPRALFVRPVHDIQRSGRRIVFNHKCAPHVLDLASGEERVVPIRACSWFRLRGDGIVLGKEESRNGMLTSILYPGPALSLVTGKPLAGPICEALVGGTCITVGDDRDVPDDDPPAPASRPQSPVPFDVRTAGGVHVHGEASLPHPMLAPDYAVLWRDAAAKTYGLVATHVDGKVGPQLVLVDAARVSILPLSEEERLDQRRIPQLRELVPSDTSAEDVEPLLRERRESFASSKDDRVRFMDPLESPSAPLPCP